jgi:hypothetical protein
MNRNDWKQMVPGLLGIASVAIGFVVWALIQFGSPREAASYIQGDRLLIEPRMAWVGEGLAGEGRQATFLVRNRSNEPVTIVGASSSCTCVLTDRLPIQIPPGEDRSLHVEFQLDGKASERVEQSLTYITDYAPQPTIPVKIAGRVIEHFEPR